MSGEETLDSLVRAAAHVPAVTPPPSLEPGTIVADTFRIERKLGAGGMGVVYLAHDVRLHRTVALKLHVGAPDEGRERMSREAKVTARLSHPNVVTLHEVGTVFGRLFLAMEYLDGGTLREWLAAKPRAWRDVLGKFVPAARGLAAAHDAGLVHLDFKPENVLLGTDGRVRVADFGLAHAADEVDALAARAGTPAYMAPEQRAGGQVDARTDQYSFCVALREALAGAPAWLRRIVARGAEADPAKRWPSMHELVAAIERRQRRARLAALAGGAAVLIATAVIVTAWLRGGGPTPCAASADRLRGAWSPARARAVADALGRAGARPAIVQGVIGSLDRYAREWARASHDACVATRVRGAESERIFELRTACLERARAQLDATAELLGSPTPARAAAALDMTRALPSLARCAGSADRLAALPPPPSEPARAAEATAIIGEVGRLWAIPASEQTDEVLARATAAAERAGRLGYAPLHADALFLRAVLLTARDPLAAEAVFLDAIVAAFAGGVDHVAAQAMSDLSWLAAIHERLDEARTWSALAHALMARHGAESREMTLRIVSNDVQVNLALGRLDEAERAASEALALSRAAPDDVEAIAVALRNVAVVHLSAGRAPEARAAAEEAVTLLDGSYGPDDPRTIGARELLARVLHRAGEIDEAAAIARVAIAAIDRRGERSARTVRHLSDLGAVLLDHGDVEEAVGLFERAAAIAERAPGIDPRVHASILGNLAVIHAGGDVAHALDLAIRSRDLFAKAPGPEANMVQPTYTVGVIARYAGRIADSARELERALAIAERALPPDHPDRLNVMVELATTRLAEKRFGDAIELLEPALAALSLPAANPVNRNEARFALARALWESGRDRARARTLARDAIRGYEELGAGGPRDEVEAWLRAR